MSTDLGIPVSGKLHCIKDLCQILERGFGDFGLKLPNICSESIEKYDINTFVKISYPEGNFCWYSINKFDKEMTEHESFEHLCMITTRLDWILAYLVSYCFIKEYKSYGINDEGAIKNVLPKYNLNNMKELIDTNLLELNKYKTDVC